jgi:hypothetical protein
MNVSTVASSSRSSSAGAAMRRALGAEWTKLRTVRTTWTNTVIAIVSPILFGGLIAFGTISEWDKMSADDRASLDPTSISLVGILVGALVMASIGIRSVAGEQNTGMLHATFAAVPHRRRVLAAKAVTVAMLTLPTALIANVCSFLVAQRVFASKAVGASLSDPGAAGAVIGSAVAVTLVAVMGVALGAAIRHIAGANTALSGILIGTQLIAVALPDAIGKFLPGAVLNGIVSTESTSDMLDRGSALAVLIAYTAVVYEIGKHRIRRE